MRLLLAGLMPAILALRGEATPAEEPSPERLTAAKPIPAVQVIPLPYERARFELNGNALTTYHHGPLVQRPHWYPLLGPSSRSLTRIGHPHGPDHHGHHHSVWLAHHDVAGNDFWGVANENRIVCTRVAQFGDSDAAAFMLTENHWLSEKRQPVLFERRRSEVRPQSESDWVMIIDTELRAPKDSPVALGPTAYGIIGVRVAKTMSVADGGGRLLNSQGQLGEEAIFRNPARWVDYSGPIEPKKAAGLALFDHPSNPGHPTPFHVRRDGWMGASLTLNGGITIEPGKPLRLRYGVWVHAGVPGTKTVDARWRDFRELELAPMTRAH